MSKIENPATTDPGSLERATTGHPPIIPGNRPSADDNLAAEIVQSHQYVSAPGAPPPMSAMTADLARFVEEEAARYAASPGAAADREFIADLVHDCETSGGINIFDPTGQIARDNKNNPVNR